MGKGHSGDNVPDRNFFEPQRNDVGVGPSNLHQEAYVDYQCPQRAGQSDRGQGRDMDRMVRIENGRQVIYAEAGSTIIINNGGDGRIGSGPAMYQPDFRDTMQTLRDSRQAQWCLENRNEMPPQYYAGQRSMYRPVSGGDYEVGYYDRPRHGSSGIGRFFENLAGRVVDGFGTGVGFNLSNRLFGHGGGGGGGAFMAAALLGSLGGGGGRGWGYDSYGYGPDNYQYQMMAMEQRERRYAMANGYRINRGWNGNNGWNGYYS